MWSDFYVWNITQNEIKFDDNIVRMIPGNAFKIQLQEAREVMLGKDSENEHKWSDLRNIYKLHSNHTAPVCIYVYIYLKKSFIYPEALWPIKLMQIINVIILVQIIFIFIAKY